MTMPPPSVGPAEFAALVLELNELKQCLALLVERAGGEVLLTEDEIVNAPHYIVQIEVPEQGPAGVIIRNVLDVATMFSDAPLNGEDGA